MSLLGKYSGKEFIMNWLNGAAIGIVTVLIPGALLTVPLKALAPIWPGALVILNATILSNAMMGLVQGMVVGYFFKLAPIPMVSVGLASMMACGVAKTGPGGKGFLLTGTGDVITMMVTAAIALIFIFAIQDKVKSFALLVIPAGTIIVAGGLGYLLYPYITEITKFVGNVVAYCVTLQPIIMCILISIIFSILIMTPITTVGIALAISLSGIGSGAANLGVCAAAFGFCVAGWKVNSLGICLAHWIGSPKISMPIILSKPKTMLPILCNAIVLGVLASIFGIEGTPFSAGFGFSGFVGPVAALDLSPAGWSAMNTLFIFVLFSVVPTLLAILFNYLFVNVLHIVTPEDYKLEMK